MERTLYAHHISHHVGLEVHDCSTLPRGGILRKGKCITIEPGLYIPDEEKWPKHFRGIGIRIEDCVVVEVGAIVEAKRVGEGSIIEINARVGKGAVIGKVSVNCTCPQYLC